MKVVMFGQCQIRLLIASALVLLATVFPVCTGGVGWAQTIDFSKPMARMGVVTMGAGVAAATCTPAYSATEKLTASIATDDTGGNEADAYFDATGWVAIGSPTIDSTTENTHAGTYKLELTASGSTEGGYRVLPLTNGTLYKLSMWVRHTGTATNNGEFRCYIGATISDYTVPVTKMLTDAVGDQTYAEYVKLFYFGTRQDVLTCAERNSDNDGGVYIDDMSIKEVTTQCLGDELITAANAATDDSNATTGFTHVTTGDGTLTAESATPDPPAGQSYYIQQTTNGEDGDRFHMDLSSYLSDSVEYFITWKQIAISGDAFTCGLAGASTAAFSTDASESVGASTADTAWIQYGFSFTYSAASHRYFKCWENGTNNNAVFAIDQLSIKQIISK